MRHNLTRSVLTALAVSAIVPLVAETSSAVEPTEDELVVAAEESLPAELRAALALPGACAPDEPLPAEDWLASIKTPGRQFTPQERHNVQVIHQTFHEEGYPHALAFAAIANAWAESALNERARMSQPFAWKGLSYPNGTGAIGLFQLLPSKWGAGGPTGPDRGYSRVFMGGRWAGTRYQAMRYADTPDGAGRRYYDGTDPRLNTQRILLEVERDGGRLMAAAERGASIAELAHIFGRDIERPQNATHHRRQLAIKMFGSELALTRHPERLFVDEGEVDETPNFRVVAAPTCARPDSRATSVFVGPTDHRVAGALQMGADEESWVSFVGAFATALSGLGLVVRWG